MGGRGPLTPNETRGNGSPAEVEAPRWQVCGLARLLARCVRRHARYVRHATQDDLDHLEALLAELREFPQLRERKRGYFSRRSQAFLHFHEDGGEFYTDVRLDSEFQRMRVTS